MKGVVEPLVRTLGGTLEVVDVDSDPALAEKWETDTRPPGRGGPRRGEGARFSVKDRPATWSLTAEEKEPGGRRFPRTPGPPLRGLPAAEWLCACCALVLSRPFPGNPD